MEQPDRDRWPTRDDLAVLYDRHAPAILAYLCQHISNVQDAEDTLLDVFLAALKRPGFCDMAAEHQLAWLHRVAHNKMVDRLRHNTRLTLTSLDQALERESAGPGPEEYSLRRESYAHLHRCLAHLTPEQQELLRLRYGEGLRLVEIATRLRKPDGTVRKQLLRALNRLRSLFNQPANERRN